MLLLIWALAIFAVFWGWVLNIVDFVSGYAAMGNGELLLRAIGVFIPLVGMWPGWF